MNPELALSYIQTCRADLKASRHTRAQAGSGLFASESESRRSMLLESAFLFQEMQCYLLTNRLEDCEERLNCLYQKTVREGAEGVWRPVYLLVKAALEQSRGDAEAAFEWWNILIQASVYKRRTHLFFLFIRPS